MASTLRYGSRGDDVRTLQTMLNQIGGYNLEVDGQYGTLTQNAVRDLQTRNGLKVDGIVGSETWGFLNSYNPDTGEPSSPSNPDNPQDTSPDAQPDPLKMAQDMLINPPQYQPSEELLGQQQTVRDLFEERPEDYKPSQGVIDAWQDYEDIEAQKPGDFVASDRTNAQWDILQELQYSEPGSYQESQAVLDALAYLQNVQGSKPGAYQSRYDSQIQSLLSDIMNREDFQYDFVADPLYQQYAQRYQQQGQMAMMDTMANAAALTGGYGSSYASTAGQQAYQQNLMALNDIIPELQQAAYQRYVDEGNEMRSNMGILQGLESADYGKYRDTVSDWYSDLNFAYNAYNDTANRDYQRYQDSMQYYYNDLSGAMEMYNMLYGQDWQQHQSLVDQFNRDREAALAKYQTMSDYDKQMWEMNNQNYHDWLAANMGYLDQLTGAELDKYGIDADLWNSMFGGYMDMAGHLEDVRQWEQEFGLEQEQWEWEKAHSNSGGGGGGGNVPQLPESNYTDPYGNLGNGHMDNGPQSPPDFSTKPAGDDWEWNGHKWVKKSSYNDESPIANPINDAGTKIFVNGVGYITAEELQKLVASGAVIKRKNNDGSVGYIAANL